MTPGSRPRVWVTRDELVYVGPALGTRPHSTAVARVLIALEEPFVLDWGSHRRQYRATLVPPRVRHRVETPGRWWSVIYLGPGSYRELRSRAGLPDHRRLVRLARARRAGALLDLLGPDGAPASRIAPVLDGIARDPSQQVPAEQAARAVGLSTSYFLREFTATTGTTYRRCCQWFRILEAARRVNGSTLTAAAVDAGFASPSHFSDTVRTIFGFTATELLATNAQITVV